MDRRTFLAGAAFASLATPVIAAPRASREFRILRDGSDIGTHTLDAVQTAAGFEVAIEIRIAVKILGVTAYRYELTNREVWQGQRLVSLAATTHDDGTDDFAKATADGPALTIAGSRFEGTAPADAGTTSYFAPALMQRTPWISTQSGTLLDVTVQPEGRANWFKVSRGLDTRLGFDANGEWVGCEFDAGGEAGIYEVTGGSGQIAALWAAA